MTEEWRDIPSLPGYQASDDVRVRSVSRSIVQVRPYGPVTRNLRGRILSTWVDPDGYPTVNVRDRSWFVHALVAEAFHGPRPAGLHVRHLDGDPANGTPANLRYGTPAENADDMLRHGRHREARKEACPLDHPLEGANLIPGQVAVGKRACLSCNRAHSLARRLRAKGAVVDFRALADAKYAALGGER
ncbi:MAG: NUMOD4 motif-containing HNH endonuclease [Pseudonocardia sp.]|nr:NUMOD4 motif-containing HNH endonuclease [Pseudonocardia sp.]MDN5931352.1 NUMOD4 motif-containing HNH endonuclease [Pseudonocardia sp.]